MINLRIGSLFSGIGGLDLGLERAGVGRVVWQVERDPFCQEVLRRHWPGAVVYDDVTEVRGGAVEPVDVLCGGFPCQDVSNAGLRAGLDGERSGLWWHYHRLVSELRPRFVVVENVAALLSRGGPDVVRSLAALGYSVWWDCVPAAAVGAPHQRDRLFLVAWLGDTLGDGLEGEHHAGAAARAALVAVRARNGWPAEPGVGGVVDGVRAGVDRMTWPTPTVEDAGRGGSADAWAQWTDEGRTTQYRLRNAVHVPMWPTPRMTDCRDSGYFQSRATAIEALPGAAGGAEVPAHARRFRPVAAWERDVPRTIPAPPRGSPESKRRKARLRALGNAVMPQVAEVVGRVVVAIHHHLTRSPDAPPSL